MEPHGQNQFRVPLFAEFYEAITDSFIDVRQVAASLKGHLPKEAELFELGLGTGYFASMFTADGYKVKGIQPDDEMLPILKRKHLNIEIVAECKLEDYEFTEHHETIISHSSVFLFTKHKVSFGNHGEELTTYIFQSFITNRDDVVRCLEKTLQALTPSGRLFINVQTNPLPVATIKCSDGQLIFEMTRCVYFLDLERVEKTFRMTYAGQTYDVDSNRFCETYTEFSGQVSRLGFKATVSQDHCWIIVSRA